MTAGKRRRFRGFGVAVASFAALATSVGSASAAAATPEAFGSHAVRSYDIRIPVPVDPRGPEGAYPDLAAKVYVPKACHRCPLFHLSHAWPGTLRQFPLSAWGRRLASRGIVVIVADRRAASASPGLQFDQLYDLQDLSTEVNSEDILRVLRWAIAESTTPGSFLHGKIDRHRLAIGGHSLGGYFATFAAVMSKTEGPRLSALVLLDPTDERLGKNTLRSSLSVAPQVRAPTIVTASEANQHPVMCDMSQGTDCTIVSRQEYAALTGTKARYGLKVVGSEHEDVEDPRTGGTPTHPKYARLFQRYAMAWLEYWIGRDCRAAAYLGHGKARRDQAAGRIAIYRGGTPLRGCPSRPGHRKRRPKRGPRHQGEDET